ncbi:unnamed protein product, partial [Prorocentrum cordatum]
MRPVRRSARRGAPRGDGRCWGAPFATYGGSYQGSRELPAGLLYHRDFVSPEEEARVLEALDADAGAWTRRIRRAQQFFSDQLGRPLREFPEWLLRRVAETGIFADGAGEINQVQANEYLGDSGIGVHVEDPAAGPAFATVSLREPVQMTLARAPGGRPVPAAARDTEDCVKVLLEPRSLLVLQG